MLSVALTVDGDNVVKVRTSFSQDQPRPQDQPMPTLGEINHIRLPNRDLESIKQEAFFHLILAHYRNQLLHLFVTESMMALSLSGCISDGHSSTAQHINTRQYDIVLVIFR